MGLGMDDATMVQWIATIIKIIVVVGVCAQLPPIMVWVERRAPAMMQRRYGPNRVGIFGWRFFGLMQSLADVLKLAVKEEVFPEGGHRFYFNLAPVLFTVPAFITIGAIPFGHPVQWGEHTIPLSIYNLPVGFLWILAISSMGVYGMAIAGWASNNKYSLLGAIRASAQVISYEIPMGLSLIPLILIYNSLDLNEIAAQQTYVWGVFKAPVSFILFFIAMFAETNRAPFDLAEGESELVAGFHTEFGTLKFITFYLAEYVNMFMLSCLVSILFFGGWQLPFVRYELLVDLTGSSLVASLIGFVVTMLKACFFMWMFVWVRWTLPRFRYDQLMSLGWKFMMPVALFNVVLTALAVQAF